MRINRVILENYGLYSGRNEIDLIPQGKGQKVRPIILIGGMNGAGKTTLLDAVRLALYGKTAIGARISEKSYQEHLRGLVHRSKNALIQFDYARVGVEFDFVLRGKRETYYVQRCWNITNGNGATESLQVYRRDAASRDGDYNTWPTLSDLEPEHWQAFISDVVPEGLSQLFFFDGEKIKRIADDISGDTAIAEAIRSLLGLDVVRRLKADLGIMATREANEHLNTEEAAAYEQVLGEIEDLKKALEGMVEKRGELEKDCAGIRGDIERYERQLQEQGGAFAQNRPAKQERQVVLEAEIRELQRRVRQECEGLFPLALCPDLAEDLTGQIETERGVRRHALLRKEIEGLQQALTRNLSKAPSLADAAVRKEALRIVRETIAGRMNSSGNEDETSVLMGLSEMDAGRVTDWLREAREKSAETMRQLCKDMEVRERETQEIRKQLDMVPDQTVLAPVFDDLKQQNQLLGGKQAELKAADEQMAALRNQLAMKEREKVRIEERTQNMASVERRLAMVGNAQKALDKYLAQLTEMKVQVLCQTVTECFNRLSRKGDLLHGVSINPKTFEVNLHDHNGRTIPREELSAGEKQILAIAILWGLAKTSGRPLPVIVDTPLGRLDSAHRMNLVQNYFPHAGHQVILLSTDTEVDKTLFDELQPSVSHCYHLVYDKAERRTYPRREYFWKEKETNHG
ncbi:MAG: DNA sulfur modification protein DndD [Candidatus Pacebacteria bacterium]|nr:DNA sulfur modification protein DndD [Candidatus Paceibacterota bacterium]